MCNRDSFILLPKETGIPVAWSFSYHHEQIGRHLREMGMIDYRPFRSSIQIECAGGDVNRWDWDNTPMRKVTRPSNIGRNRKIVWEKMGERAAIEYFSIEVIEEPDLPLWLEDNLAYYQDKVGNILEKTNPLRDLQDSLRYRILKSACRKPEYVTDSWEIDELVKGADSVAVQQFEHIVNGYMQIEGFTHKDYSRRKPQDYVDYLSVVLHERLKPLPAFKFKKFGK